jgi:pimeloyl-ACP methyl ester carboxylesterase
LRIEKFRSKDGTLLAYRQDGAGPPLILVHGTGASSTRWQPILSTLTEHFRVYAVDRRGRADSGDSPDYSLEREFEDVASLVDFIQEPVFLLGHSFGGICALEATLLTPHIRKLILYEPPIPVGDSSTHPNGLINQLEALLAAGDREGVLTKFVQEVLRMSPRDFENYRASATWPARVAAAHTLPRELQAQEHYRFVPERFKDVILPTLLLTGENSPVHLKAATQILHATIPMSRVVILPGQGHVAMDTASDLFLHEIMIFLKESV